MCHYYLLLYVIADCVVFLFLYYLELLLLDVAIRHGTTFSDVWAQIFMFVRRRTCGETRCFQKSICVSNVFGYEMWLCIFASGMSIKIVFKYSKCWKFYFLSLRPYGRASRISLTLSNYQNHLKKKVKFIDLNSEVDYKRNLSEAF